MKLLSFFLPQTVETVYSPINGRIRVVKSFGNISILVSGLSQSGGLVKNLWEIGFKQFNNLAMKQCNNVLVLGVGGGTVIQSLSKYFPNAKILGIEIDPMMIELGKKYFALGENNNVHIIIDDAIKWVTNKKYHGSIRSTTFDLVIIDLFLGRKVPEELYTIDFLKHLKKLLSPKGEMIINQLRQKENHAQIDIFIATLKELFPRVTIEKPLVNDLIHCK